MGSRLLSFFLHCLVLIPLARLAIYLAQADQAVKSLLKGIVMTDDDELVEATHAPDLLAAAQLGKAAADALTAQDDLVVVLPGKLGAAITHDLAKDAVCLGGDITKHSFQNLGRCLLNKFAEEFRHHLQFFKCALLSLCCLQCDELRLCPLDLLFKFVDRVLQALHCLC